ncbi:2-nitropropane dioxygenase, partial [bacterium]|nr:2-nitropropane dioxygenase [bacterium]
FFQDRSPSLIEASEGNPRLTLALIIRYYLERSYHYAIEGDESKKLDFNVRCGLDLASFNQWREGGLLESAENLSVVQIALNLLMGAQFEIRKQFLSAQGLDLDQSLKYEASILAV